MVVDRMVVCYDVGNATLLHCTRALSALSPVGYNGGVMQEVQEQAERAPEKAPEPNEAHHEASKRIVVGVGAVLTLFVFGLVLWFMVGR